MDLASYVAKTSNLYPNVLNMDYYLITRNGINIEVEIVKSEDVEKPRNSSITYKGQRYVFNDPREERFYLYDSLFRRFARGYQSPETRSAETTFNTIQYEMQKLDDEYKAKREALTVRLGMSKNILEICKSHDAVQQTHLDIILATIPPENVY